MASIHGTVSTILAVHSRAPCSPCMNWLRRQFWPSMSSSFHSLGPKFRNGESGWAVASSRKRCIWGLPPISVASFSTSTSVSHGRSVSPFHCEDLAFSYSLFSAGRAPFS